MVFHVGIDNKSHDTPYEKKIQNSYTIVNKWDWGKFWVCLTVLFYTIAKYLRNPDITKS